MPVPLLLLFCLAFAGGLAAQDTIWVRPGATAGSGSRAAPLGSLVAARDAARARRGAGRRPIVVLRAGEYLLSSTLLLSARDGGTSQAPAVWTALPGERARLLGARRVELERISASDPIMSRLPREARVHVRAVRLPSGVRPPGAGDWNRPGVPELFDDAGPLDLVRFPDTGWVRLSRIDSTAATTRLRIDRALPFDARAPGLTIQGYFFWDWAAGHVAADSSVAGHIFVPTGRSAYGWKVGQRVAFLNHPSLLRRARTYAYDPQGSRLLVWAGEAATHWLAVLDQPLVQVDSASHLRISELTLGWTGGQALVLNAADSAQLDRLDVRYTGSDAVVVRGGTGVRVRRSRIVGAGYSALVMEGGDRRTLRSSGQVAEDNRILGAGRWWPTMRAVRLRGVGQRFAHNEVADMPFEAVLAQGNDFVIEANRFHHLLTGSRDAGVIYLGRDWTERGTVIRGNLFHDVGGLALDESREVAGVYLDDVISGTTIEQNVFVRVPSGIHLGGGRDNTIRANAFLCTDPAVFISFRGEWAEGMWGLRGKAREVAHDRPPYSTRYPALRTLFDGDPWEPLGNVIDENAVTSRLLVRHQGRSVRLTPSRTTRMAMRCDGTEVDALIGIASRASGQRFPRSADVGPREQLGPTAAPPE